MSDSKTTDHGPIFPYEPTIGMFGLRGSGSPNSSCPTFRVSHVGQQDYGPRTMDRCSPTNPTNPTNPRLGCLGSGEREAQTPAVRHFEQAMSDSKTTDCSLPSIVVRTVRYPARSRPRVAHDSILRAVSRSARWHCHHRLQRKGCRLHQTPRHGLLETPGRTARRLPMHR